MPVSTALQIRPAERPGVRPTEVAPTPEAARPTDGRHPLLDVTIALNTVGDVGRLMEVIVEAATRVTDCEAASILLYDEPSRSLRFEAASGVVGAALVGQTVPLEGSLAGAIFTADCAHYAPDARADARHYRVIDESTGFCTRGLMGVPMRIDGQPVGVIEVLNPRRGAFRARDAEALLVVAAQAAVALRNARHEQALRLLNDRLAQLDQLKTNFLAITSHELRTPLTSVRGFGQILQDEVPDALRPYAHAVVRAGYRMTNVIETLDVMAGLQSDLGRHPTRRIALHCLLMDVLEAARDVTGDVLVSFPDHVLVEGVASRLRLALDNLVRNAAQFSPDGAPIYVDATESGGTLHVRVADEGRGLAPEDLERIFEAYVQVQDADHRDHEGLGVGLTVARAVAVQHGGQLWAESAGPGRGATFHLTLPTVR